MNKVFQVKDFSQQRALFLLRDVWRLGDSLDNTHTHTLSVTLYCMHSVSHTQTHTHRERSEWLAVRLALSNHVVWC